MFVDKLVVEIRVIRQKHHAVIAGEGFGRELHRFQIEAMLAHPWEDRNIRIRIVENGAARAQDLHDEHGGGLAHVVNVALVGNAERQDAAALDGATALVQRVGDLGHHPLGHLAVDLAGKLDEVRGKSVFPRLPREIERIDRDAVAAEPRARIVAGKAEGLRGRRVDHLINVEPHAVGDDLHLVHETDIDRAMDVFQKLRQLRRLGARHRHDPLDRHAVEGFAHLPAGRRDAAKYLGDGVRGELGIAGILPLGRIDDEIVLPDREASAFDIGTKHLAGRAGIGRTFQRKNLVLAQVRRDRFHCSDDEGEVRLAMAAERRRHTDDDSVRLRDAGEVARGFESPLLHGGDVGRPDMLDGAFAFVHRPNARLVDIKAEDAKANGAKAERKRNTDIAKTDDADDCLLGPQFLRKLHLDVPFLLSGVADPSRDFGRVRLGAAVKPSHIPGMHLLLKGFDFGLERLVFGKLAAQEASREPRLLGDAFRGEVVGVADLVLRIPEVARLHEPLFDERVENVVHASERHAQPVGNVTLRHVGVLLEHAQNPEPGIVTQLSCHGCVVVLACRSPRLHVVISASKTRPRSGCMPCSSLNT